MQIDLCTSFHGIHKRYTLRNHDRPKRRIKMDSPDGARAPTNRGSLDPAKARRAAARSDRPGEQCAAEPGRYRPVIDRSRCEGKADCVAVCPYGVFEVRRIDDGDFARLSWLARLKLIAHGRKSAYTPAEDACRACGLCVVACPEKAIALLPG
jgi:NAD-dependent dihydropyrimidine dehydrogenase PreA subunit